LSHLLSPLDYSVLRPANHTHSSSDIGRRFCKRFQKSLRELIDRLYEDIAAHGLDILSPYRGKHPGDLALPRKFELAAAVNRLRTLQARTAVRGTQ